MAKFTKEEALNYHSMGRPGKIEVIPTKPYRTQMDLSLAYSPGVAEPCLEIQKNPQDVYKYTAKGNLVAVISNGTAVLGLGNIGASAGKPVMEGKGLLFKIFADVDVFDIEIETMDVEKFIETVKQISPTFGGINLEDIKAPECFEIEARLKKELDIPIMHDDQHGTAIISGAGLLNALELVNKKIGEIKVVVCGAGASAISCSRLYISLGVKRENIIMADSRGVLHPGRTDINEIKKEFVRDIKARTLEEAIVGADLFLGLSTANQLSKKMLKSMNANPIVFAMANPDPEISYEDAMDARNDLIFATGRSDYPNQINNVLGFPFIFRGALDVAASAINEEMKLAAAMALSELAKQPVPEEVNIAYKTTNLKFGKEYIIPKPLDPRLILTIAPAVAKAAMDSGVARKPIKDWDAYNDQLRKRLGLENTLIRQIKARAQRDPKRVVFAEAENYKMLKAAEIVKNEEIATPILLGDVDNINKMAVEFGLDISGIEIIDPISAKYSSQRIHFTELYYARRQRKGATYTAALDRMSHRNYFSAMMVDQGLADAMVSGLTRNYPDTIRPALQIIGKKEGAKIVSGMYIIQTKKGPFFFADTTINKDPNVEQLVEITLQTVSAVRQFNIEPRVAMLSYSNFGSNKGMVPEIVQQAVAILHRDYPDLIVDGDIQANFALNNEMLKENFPFSKLVDNTANTLIFPYLTAGNIAYKLMQELAGAHVIGPIINGLNKSVHILQLGSSVNEIVDIVTIAVLDAQFAENRAKSLEKANKKI